MKDIVTSTEIWEQRCKCAVCQTEFTVEHEDLQTDMFKKSGTYWWNDTAVVERRFHVNCPNCSKLLFVDKRDIPYNVRYCVVEKQISA